MTVLANLAAYAVMLYIIVSMARRMRVDQRLIQAYRRMIEAQTQRHAFMMQLVDALRRENALLKKEKALFAHAAKPSE